MRAVIPMAGEGSRFAEKGYTFPKPLIDVNGKPMIQVVLETLPECSEYIFLCRLEHISEYSLGSMLQQLTDNRATVVPVETLTEGAACTVLLAEELINDQEELIIANSDQYVEYDHRNFDILRHHSNANGIIFTFNASHPKWSFARCDEYGNIDKVAEKDPISNVATCGIYYFSSGNMFCVAANQMIHKNIRTNNEFYLAPVYNEMIDGGFKVLPFFVDHMSGLGTPEDLENFIQRRQ